MNNEFKTKMDRLLNRVNNYQKIEENKAELISLIRRYLSSLNATITFSEMEEYLWNNITLGETQKINILKDCRLLSFVTLEQLNEIIDEDNIATAFFAQSYDNAIKFLCSLKDDRLKLNLLLYEMSGGYNSYTRLKEVFNTFTDENVIVDLITTASIYRSRHFSILDVLHILGKKINDEALQLKVIKELKKHNVFGVHFNGLIDGVLDSVSDSFKLNILKEYEDSFTPNNLKLVIRTLPLDLKYEGYIYFRVKIYPDLDIQKLYEDFENLDDLDKIQNLVQAYKGRFINALPNNVFLYCPSQFFNSVLNAIKDCQVNSNVVANIMPTLGADESILVFQTFKSQLSDSERTDILADYICPKIIDVEKLRLCDKYGLHGSKLISKFSSPAIKLELTKKYRDGISNILLIVKSLKSFEGEYALRFVDEFPERLISDFYDLASFFKFDDDEIISVISKYKNFFKESSETAVCVGLVKDDFKKSRLLNTIQDKLSSEDICKVINSMQNSAIKAQAIKDYLDIILSCVDKYAGIVEQVELYNLIASIEDDGIKLELFNTLHPYLEERKKSQQELYNQLKKLPMSRLEDEYPEYGAMIYPGKYILINFVEGIDYKRVLSSFETFESVMSFYYKYQDKISKKELVSYFWGRLWRFASEDSAKRLERNDNFQKFYDQNIVLFNWCTFEDRTSTIALDFVTEENAEDYFDENGPTLKLFETLVYDKSNLNAIASNLRLYEVYPNFSKFLDQNIEVLRYFQFVKKYGFHLDIITGDNIKEYFDSDAEFRKIKDYFKNNFDVAQSLLEMLVHNPGIGNNPKMDLVELFEGYILGRYFKNCPNPIERYKYLFDKIGPILLFNLSSDSIQKLIDASDTDFKKVFSILSFENTSLVPSNVAYDNFVISLARFKFDNKCTEDKNIFPILREIVTRMNRIEFEDYINNNIISGNSSMLDRLLKKIINKLNYSDEDIALLKRAIIECREFNFESLSKICVAYIRKCRVDFLEENKHTILKEFNIDACFDLQDAIKKSSMYLSYDNFVKFSTQYKYKIENYGNLSSKFFIESLKMTKQEYEILMSITSDEYNLIQNVLSNGLVPDESIRKKLALYKKYISAEITNKNSQINRYLNRIGNVSRNYSFMLEQPNLLNIVCNIDIDMFLSWVNKNPNEFETLNRLMKNYFLGRLPLSLSAAFEIEYNKKLIGGINNIANFITRFHQIYKDKQRWIRNNNVVLKDKDHPPFTFVEIVDLISSVNSEKYEIRRLFGRAEYSDFMADRGPNSSNQYAPSVRESKLSAISDYLYTVGDITIPPKDILISNLNGDKTLNIIVGNRTNASNICHGERTGACMRIGGVGEGLFLKCLTNKNWFHIRIEDPETHEYISRISCFRNGNTVYFNQLRESTNPKKYTNKDLQECITKYAKGLIEETKDSKYPIENVFINYYYGMLNYEYPGYNGVQYNLGSSISKEYSLDGLSELQVSGRDWIDVKSGAILLATTEEGLKAKKGYVELKNGPENTEVYPATRDKIYGSEIIDTELEPHKFVKLSNEFLEEKINRVNAMKEKLSGKDFRYDIEDIDVSTLVEGYASSDWYAFIDYQKQIHCDFIDASVYKNAHFAKEEMDKYVKLLSEKYEIEQESSYEK